MLKTPFSLGYRMPAEWEPHEATWIGWPHNASDWPGKLSAIHWVYAEIVRKICEGEQVRILVNSKAHEERAKKFLKKAHVPFERLEFHRFATNRGWTRDFMPAFIHHQKKGTAASAFRFNAWARYSDWRLDAQVPDKISRKLKISTFEVQWQGKKVVLEGGAIDVNGKGTLLTTEECLLDKTQQVRNPDLEKEDLEAIFRDYLGVSNTLWLGKGIVGDDTHGHIDDICRFVNPNTVVLAQEENPEDENYAALKDNLKRVQSFRLEEGSPLNIVPLPMPSPLYFDGFRLPASYANFYICNKSVLVPTFNDPQDRVALATLERLFPDRTLVGVHAVDLVLGFGTLHCLTHEQPSQHI